MSFKDYYQVGNIFLLLKFSNHWNDFLHNSYWSWFYRNYFAFFFLIEKLNIASLRAYHCQSMNLVDWNSPRGKLSLSLAVQWFRPSASINWLLQKPPSTGIPTSHLLPLYSIYLLELTSKFIWSHHINASSKIQNGFQWPKN